ncbi:CBS domain-containing protein [Streptomyces sp. MUM 203J]|uniref:CBS domain-containing protein n=1 Tax=Streptomyces sp. MUM 203J TaxID=2791990 RepID=UPI001F048D57|nr:CBS domain-containing protein [Streptomyces sp. MUM 203J]MCH0541609.1 CBS domain-containing protein [Streptomyces sp. MUM 203J]
MSAAPRVVSDVMTQTAVAVGSRASYKEIVELMSQWEVSALPVLAGEGRVIGVVSEADLLLKEGYREEDAAVPDGRPFARVAKADAVYAEDLMTSPAVTVHADAPIAEAARIMARRHVKRLPVVDRLGMLEGVVSRGDLLKVFLRSDEDIAAEVRETVLSELPRGADVRVSVENGVVTLGGRLPEPSSAPLLARAVRAVEGVVDIRVALRSGDG